MIFTITGANGFLGVHIIHHLLAQGHTVKAIRRPNSSLTEYQLVKSRYALKGEVYNRLTWHECDLYDIVGLENAMKGSDYVMHLAGMISYRQQDYDEMLMVNQSYTSIVVNICLSMSIKKLLYCSSIAAITKNDKRELIKEDVEWNNEVPHSNYGYTKHLGEYEMWRAQEEGLNTVAINPGIILGYGDWTKGSNQLFGNAKKGFPFYSQGVTGWVGVKDVARIAEKLCVSDISAERFILVSENLSFKRVADLMCEYLGARKPQIEIKGLLYRLAYALVWVKELLGLRGMLSKETVKASVAINYFDNGKVKSSLGYKFDSIEEVIADAT